jgi:hypothetical protein
MTSACGTEQTRLAVFEACGKPKLVVFGALLAASFCQGTAALAQTILALSPEQHFYASPMVLEFTLDELIHKNASAATDIANRSCRGVTIESLSLRRNRIGHEDWRHKITMEKFQRLWMTLKIFNNSGKDKRVGIHFDFAQGDRLVSSPVEVHLNLEQGETVTKEVDLPFLLENTENEPVTPTPRLRITLTAVDY